MKKRKLIMGAVLFFCIGCAIMWIALSGSRQGSGSLQIAGGWDGSAGVDSFDSSVMNSMPSDVAYDIAYTSEEGRADSGFTDLSHYGKTDQKWIVTVDMSAETKEYDDFMANLNESMNKYGAYAENSDERDMGGYYHSRRSNLLIRVPVENLDAFLSDIGDACNVTSKSRRMENITLAYNDAETYKQTLEIEQDKLLELLGQAQTVDEIIQVRDRLSQLQYQIEMQGTRLRTYDDQVAFATVHFSVDEVVELSREPVNFFERVISGIKKNLSDIREFVLESLLWILTHLPALVLLAGVGFICRFVYKFRKKRRNRKLSAGIKELKKEDAV